MHVLHHFNASRRHVFLLFSALAASAITLAPSAVCRAQIGFSYDWTKPNGGNYGTNTNWSPVGIPDDNTEGANFGLSSTYNVTLANNFTVKSLGVSQGDVRFSFQSHPTPGSRYIYTANSMTVDASVGSTAVLTLDNGDVRPTTSLTIGSSGQGSLSLDNNLLTSASSQIGASTGSSGQVALDLTSIWTNTGPLAIGATGNGTLDLVAGYRAISILGGPPTYFVAQSNAISNSTVMGQNAGGHGVANVAGIFRTGSLVVGAAGAAEINLLATQATAPNSADVSSAGILKSTNATIAEQPGSSGVVNVTGFAQNGSHIHASEWQISGNLAIGGSSNSAGGAGQLKLGAANSVSVNGNLKMWSGGKLTFTETGTFAMGGTATLAGALEFLLPASVQPILGSQYEILAAAGGVSNKFDSATFPALSGNLSWSVIYAPTTVSVKVVQGVAGDYNQNGIVDTADYTLWRDKLGSGTALPNDDTVGVDLGDYTRWKTRFGQITGAGAGSVDSLSVPEPGVSLLVMIGSLLFAAQAPHRSPSPRDNQPNSRH